jgi:ABC transporter substrate binding protein
LIRYSEEYRKNKATFYASPPASVSRLAPVSPLDVPLSYPSPPAAGELGRRGAPQEIDSAFEAMTRERVGALVILNDAILLNQRNQIADLATQARLPSVSGNQEYAEAGGLLVYSADFLDLERRAATFVDKILKGAKPGDLPVEQPTKFQLILNLLADEVIQ